MQQNNVVDDNSDKFRSINVEQNIDVVNDNSDKCSSVNAVADSQPVESLSSSDDPPTWAEVVDVEEAATFTAPAPSIEPVHGRKARSLCWFWSSCAPPFSLPCTSQRCAVGQVVFLRSFFSS